MSMVTAMFNVGDQVRVKEPDGWVANVAAKIRDRTGEVTRIRADRSLVVHFPKLGRRKPFTHHFRERDLAAAVEAGRSE